MFKTQPRTKTTIKVNKGYPGETIEKKVARILNNKEPIKDGAPLIYTERKEGVKPSYNIRTDRFEIAVEAMQGVSKAHIAKREERAKIIEMEAKKDDRVEPIQGTTNQ